MVGMGRQGLKHIVTVYANRELHSLGSSITKNNPDQVVCLHQQEFGPVPLLNSRHKRQQCPYG